MVAQGHYAERALVAILRTKVEVFQESIYQWIEGRSLEAEAKLHVVDANITEGIGKTSEIIRKSDQAKEGLNFALMAYTSLSLDSKIVRLLTTARKGLDEFANKPVVENSEAESSQEKPKEVKKNTDALIIKE
nr:hypothetical protein [Tanacetum cinerariifolium]